MAVIADSSVLIIFAKISRLYLLKKLYKRVIIPPSVYQEVVIEGRKLHKAGANEIEEAIEAGWIEVVPLTEEQLKSSEKYKASRLGKGEAEAIALAKNRKALLLLDDKIAREIATKLGINFLGTPGALLEAYLLKFLNKKEFMVGIRDLGKVMWLSPDVISELIRFAVEEEND